MIKNLKDSIRSRVKTVGCFISIPHPAAVEATVSDEIDFLCLDAEHASIDRGTLENMLRAADASKTPVLVRVPDLKGSWIQWALDSGAKGIVVPRVETVEDAKRVVDAAYYPPKGCRGVGASRGSGYGADLANVVEVAHFDTAVIVQIETYPGVLNAESIAAVDGIDAVFIGPFDLAQSLLSVPEGSRPTFEEAIQLVELACEKANRSMGVFRMNYDDIEKWNNYSLLIIGTDAMFIQTGIKANKSRKKSAT